MASEDQNKYHIFQWHFIVLNNSNFHSSNSQGLFLLLSFFLILILITALFLFAHFCRRRFSLRPSAAAATAAVTTSPLHAHQWVGVEVDYGTALSMLPWSITNKSHSLVDDGGFEKMECCICLSLFQDHEKLKVLKECQHVYHSECVDKWLSAQPSCPQCRASLQVSDSLKKSIISS